MAMERKEEGPCPLGKPIRNCANLKNGLCASPCKPAVAQCCGCDQLAGAYCRKYTVPVGHWRNGLCSDHSELRTEMLTTAAAVPAAKVNPLKANRASAPALAAERRRADKEVTKEAVKQAKAAERARAGIRAETARKAAAGKRAVAARG